MKGKISQNGCEIVSYQSEVEGLVPARQTRHSQYVHCAALADVSVPCTCATGGER